MKQHIQPINKEKFLSDDEIIVSKSDNKGLFTYCNQVLLDISGFEEEELLGRQHNTVRHPDMPRAVFQLLWDTVKAGDEFNGYVKNMSKDGGFYWVLANVTASYSPDGKLLGYYSVRRSPKKEAIVVIDGLYKKMLAAEKAAGARDAIDASLAILNSAIEEKGVSYDEFVFSI